LRWRDTPDFVEVANSWHEDAITVLVGLVWQGYDLLREEVLSEINCNQAEEQLERSITQLLERRIRRSMTGYEPFDVQHEVFEWESRQSAQAQPPQYDIAFFLRANEMIIWPLEAKVLSSDGAVAPYVQDIQNEFLTCRYAPFSSEGGMLGYLFSGEPSRAFRRIEVSVRRPLSHHPQFPNRDHKKSHHRRSVPSGRQYPANFCCHHLILQITGSVASTAS
jgi:hypothetical protein